jgi:hypothetical protein
VKILRIVLLGPPGSPGDTLGAIEAGVKSLPKGSRYDLVQLPGGSLGYGWSGPAMRGGWSQSWSEAERAAEDLRALAENEILQAADLVSGISPHLTIGVDWGSSTGGARDPRLEYVATVDTEHGEITGWCGKFYPYSGEEDRLILNPNPALHCQVIGGRRAVVLGCHDLTVFSRRSLSVQKQTHDGKQGYDPNNPRSARYAAFQKAFRAYRPEVVLHHPHGTDLHTTWQVAYFGLRTMLPGVQYSSGIGYYHYPDKPPRPKSSLEEVLSETASAGVESVIVPSIRRRR